MTRLAFASRIPRLAVPVFAALLASMGFASADGIPHAGDVAPAFTTARATGGDVKLSDYRGKALYLNFFASWCAPCNEEAPSVGVLFKKYKAHGLNVLGVNELEDKGKALAFAHQYKWPFAIAVDSDGNIGRQYGALGLPVHIFIDKSGKVSTFRLGEMNPAEIEAAIKKIL